MVWTVSPPVTLLHYSTVPWAAHAYCTVPGYTEQRAERRHQGRVVLALDQPVVAAAGPCDAAERPGSITGSTAYCP